MKFYKCGNDIDSATKADPDYIPCSQCIEITRAEYLECAVQVYVRDQGIAYDSFIRKVKEAE